jgi:hypothetical protein
MYFFALAAAALALYFVAAAFRRLRPAEILAAILWASYAVYEYLVANGTLCDASCNIRVDLVLFLPLLGSASYLALRKEPGAVAVTLLAVICLVVVALLAYAFGNAALAGVAGVGALVVGALGIRSGFAARQP